MRLRVVAIIIATLGVVAPVGARADDQRVLRIADTLLPRASQKAFVAAGGRGGATAVQAQYDAARDIQDALIAAAPASTTCAPLMAVLGDFAKAEINQAESFDRQSPSGVTRAGVAATHALAGYVTARASCVASPASATPTARPARIDDPGDFEAFFGAVRARAPAAATAATISINGRLVGHAAVTNGWLRTRVSAPPTHGRLEVTFLSASGAIAGRAVSESVWLLPNGTSTAPSTSNDDAALSAALSREAASFRGISAIYAVDLATGTEASWNAEGHFPAASTVKLGVLAAALKRFGPRPEQHPTFYDLQALAAWSSNLAANRLLEAIGGSTSRGAALAQDELHR
jgi:hypothetical protein